ncbi:[NiFe]-hydrogenase assembly chaperone HybE [Amycolatopsis mongoliensis]|uniref:[NiFe]-hydrogenase assembly chaperone HybE n=1 Tax=Amycolatopsis mongoliensis TaxID=715475 RepID=A0A9Y2NI88_9PSEU|nr:[NiFe]-hydrogenase assembly chaperone HybE [Amycolatopsis sp. 4-36]WIY00498.1 [NiFe]-hydrogenase assembly chaperone HybE [Amycolatopsis sp. 4-36]
MDPLDGLTDQVRRAFDRISREKFRGDPVANPRLTVDVLGAAVVAGVPTMVVLTPWTITGLAFPPDDVFPSVLEIAGRPRPVYRLEVAGLGTVRSVTLPTETAALRGMAQARDLARSWVEPFRLAVRAARA